MAQVVFTVVTQTSLTTGVLFQINGEPIPVPIGNGTSVIGAGVPLAIRDERWLRRRHERDTAAMTAVIRF